MITLVRAYWKPLALLVAVVLWSAIWLAVGLHIANTDWQAKWSARDLADVQAAQAFTEEQRRIELQRQGAIDAIQTDAQQRIAKAQRNAAIADAESDRLRDGITAAIGRLQSGGGDTGNAINGQARDKAGLLLAELFREIDTAAGRYAAEADRAYEAGLTCERAYDAIRSDSSEKKSSKSEKNH